VLRKHKKRYRESFGRAPKAQKDGTGRRSAVLRSMKNGTGRRMAVLEWPKDSSLGGSGICVRPDRVRRAAKKPGRN
jgi:hypothetical protein